MFVEQSKSGKAAEGGRFIIAKLDDRTANELQTITGLDARNYGVKVDAAAAKSIADAEALSRVSWLLKDPDTIQLKSDPDKPGGTFLRFTKEAGENTYVVEALPDAEGKAIWITDVRKQADDVASDAAKDSVEDVPEIETEDIPREEAVIEEAAEDPVISEPEPQTPWQEDLTNDGENDSIQYSEQPRWSGKEAAEPFDYWELSSDKTAFPRRWKPTGFSSKTTLDDHYTRHGVLMQAKSKEEYQQKAIEFLTSPRGKYGDAFVTPDGDIYRYDYHTHEFAIARSNGIIRTYWKLTDTKTPEKADKYWEAQKR